jgi:acyl carrier protein
MSQEQLSRVAQLTQRTNQMNVTTIRRSESDIQALLRQPDAECLTVDVADRFGSYGLTGVVIYRTDPEALSVDTFLLSCRVLGRGVEHKVFSRLGEIAAEKGLPRVDVPFVPSQRNRPALLFLESVGADYKEKRGHAMVFRFPVEYARAVAYNPDSVPSRAADGAAGEPEPRRTAQREVVDFVRIAKDLSSPLQILDRVRARSRDAGGISTPSAAPRTALERQLAGMWAELLNIPSVGIYDNFFDLGGHSLLAVQLLSRVRQAFDVELSLEVVYSRAFTVAELAKAVELREIEQVGADQYAAILAELEGLSDDEVDRLLAQETGRSEIEEPR